MKKLLSILTMALLLNVGAISAQCCGEKPNYTQWLLTRSWANSFKALPEVCTNIPEFYSQYHKNKAQWDAVFSWLAKNDLVNMAAGKYDIPGTNIQANVQDGVNDPLAKRGSESHYHHVDLQYVVKGCERFGLLDHDSSYPNRGYKPDVMGYTYDASKTMFIDSTPNRFFMFFPSDWHIAKVMTDNKDQNIRVVVVKLDYIK